MQVTNEEIMKINIVPNLLSLFRLILVPVFVCCFFWLNQYVALGIFVLASITDILDGYIARHYNAITELGKILDPFADKLMKAAALICLSIAELIPYWITIVMITCDLAMIISGFCIYKKHITIPSNFLGKLGTCLISLGVVLSFFAKSVDAANVIFIYTGIGTAIISGLYYVYIFFTKKINKKPKKTSPSQDEKLNFTQNPSEQTNTEEDA